MTVLGHSYGATTVADAFAASGAHANDVILLGSPGTDLAHSAADFHLDGGQCMSGRRRRIRSAGSGESGVVPDGLNESARASVRQVRGSGHGSGGERVRLHPVPTRRYPAHDGLSFHDHSHYYDLGGDALRSMAHIVTGHGAALAGDGLLAQGRRQPHITTPSEINLPLLGPIHLPHIDTRIPGLSGVHRPGSRTGRGRCPVTEPLTRTAVRRAGDGAGGRARHERSCEAAGLREVTGGFSVRVVQRPRGRRRIGGGWR